MMNEDYKLQVTECCKFSEEEKKAVAQIKKWILTLNRNATCDCGNIMVSQHRKEMEDGSNPKETLLCICDSDAPVIKIEKPVVEVSLEDILGVYNKINSVENITEEVV